MEEELKNTKDVWTTRLADEKKQWRGKANEKVSSIHSVPLCVLLEVRSRILTPGLSNQPHTYRLCTINTKSDTLQNQIDKTRDFYKNQVEHLHRELAEILGSRRQVKEELDMALTHLEDEKSRRKTIKRVSGEKLKSVSSSQEIRSKHYLSCETVISPLCIKLSYRSLRSPRTNIVVVSTLLPIWLLSGRDKNILPAYQIMLLQDLPFTER